MDVQPTESAVSIAPDLEELEELARSRPHDKQLTGAVALDLIRKVGTCARNIARKANVIEAQRDTARAQNVELQQTIDAQREELTKLRGLVEGVTDVAKENGAAT